MTACRLLCGCLLTAAASIFVSQERTAAQTISSTFDEGLEGWTAVDVDIDTSFGAVLSGNLATVTSADADITFDSGGDFNRFFTGAPGGFARYTGELSGPLTFASAPAEFLGDLSGFLGGTFSFDHREFNQGSGLFIRTAPYSVIFVSGDLNDFNAYGAVFDGPPPGQPDTGFVTSTANLVEGGPNGLQPITDLEFSAFDPQLPGTTINTSTLGDFTTSLSLEQVLSNVTQVLVSFELADNNLSFVNEAAGLDNIVLQAPEGTPGDFNGDGAVDTSDYTVWRDGLGSAFTIADYQTWVSNFGLGVPALAGDFNTDGTVDAADYTVWRDRLGAGFTIADYQQWVSNFGAGAPASAAVPEPASLTVLATIGLTAIRRRR